MKKGIFIIILAGITWSTYASEVQILSIGEALARKSVQCRLQASTLMPDSLAGRSGYLLRLDLANNTSLPLRVRFESGRTFNCADTAVQNLILTEDRIVSLPAGKQQVYQLMAYCIQKKKDQPDHSRYSIGTRAHGLLLKAANFLGKKKIRTPAASSAIWVVTDKIPIEDVKGKTADETRLLRNYLYELTGAKRPPRNLEPLSWPRVSVSGNLCWEMKVPDTISIFVYDKNNVQVGKLLSNQAYPNGKQIYTFHYQDDVLMPLEPYRVVLVKKGRIISELAVRGKED